MRYLRLALIGLVVTALLPSLGTIVKFQKLSKPESGFNGLGDKLFQDGYVFNLSSGPYGRSLGVWKDRDPSHPVGGPAATALTSYYTGNTLTITRQDGRAFELKSIDLAPWGVGQDGGKGSSITNFVGLKRDGRHVSQNFAVKNYPGSPRLQHFVFKGFTGLKKVSVQQGTYGAGAGWQMTNLNVTP